MMIPIDNEKIFMISAIIIITAFLIRTPVMCRPRKFRYEYSARTDDETQDHTYVFQVRMLKDGSYRCYIVKAPFLFGKRFTRYAVSFIDEKGTGNRYIFSNRKIRKADDARKLCADWSNANQYLVDNCRFRK